MDGRRLLVDCGLYQGLKDLRLRNWERAARRSRADRRRRPDARPHRPHRLPAAARQGRLRRARSPRRGGPRISRGSCCRTRATSRRRRPRTTTHGGRRSTRPRCRSTPRRRAPGPPRRVTRASTTRSRSGSCRASRRRSGGPGTSSARRPSALELEGGRRLRRRLVFSGDIGRYAAPDPPRSGADGRGRLHLRRVDLRRPAARPHARARSDRARRPGRGTTAGAPWWSRPSPSAGPRS